MSCEKACFEASIESCGDIIIKAGLTATTSYYWIIQKPGSANIYQRLVTTNGDGDLTILKADLPAGFFVNGDYFNITIRKGTDYLQSVVLTFGATEYNCILAKLVNVNRDEDDDSDINVIQYQVPEVPAP